MQDLTTLIEKMRRSNYGANLFSRQSCDMKRDAQRNLEGKTHYVDDSTLRYHHARIVGANVEAGGLLYRLVEGVALDMHNTRRGFRFVVFDIFGTVVSDVPLDSCYNKSQKAFDAANAWLESFDVAAHYRETFANRAARLREDATFWDDCAGSL